MGEVVLERHGQANSAAKTEEEIETKEEAIAVKIDEEQFEELKDSMKSEENEQDD